MPHIILYASATILLILITVCRAIQVVQTLIATTDDLFWYQQMEYIVQLTQVVKLMRTPPGWCITQAVTTPTAIRKHQPELIRHLYTMVTSDSQPLDKTEFLTIICLNRTKGVAHEIQTKI